MITVQSSTIVLLKSTVDYHVYNVAHIIVCKLNKVRVSFRGGHSPPLARVLPPPWEFGCPKILTSRCARIAPISSHWTILGLNSISNSYIIVV